MNKSPTTERGATVVLVAISLLMLLGMAALAVDAGMGYNERRGTTNAADNAALAAAWEECNPEGVGPEAAAVATAAENGFDNDDPNVEVTPTSIAEGEWQVTISEDNEGTFGPATPYANDSLTVVSEAVALCDPTEFLEGNAIFAGGDICGPKELNLTGSSIEVDGAIHSNGDLLIHATPETEILSGPITYRDTGTHGTKDTGPPSEYPLDIDISEYDGGARATGLYFPHPTDGVIDNEWLEDEGHIDPDTGLLNQSGIYYTDFSSNGKAAIELQDLSVEPGVTVTFVSRGYIHLKGGTFENYRAHDKILPGGSVGILFFSDYPGPPPGDCNSNAIRLSSASLLNASGVMYAPNGGIQFSSSQAVLDGSVIGWTVNSSGSELTIRYQDDPAFVPKYQVELLR